MSVSMVLNICSILSRGGGRFVLITCPDMIDPKKVKVYGGYNRPTCSQMTSLDKTMLRLSK